MEKKEILEKILDSACDLDPRDMDLYEISAVVMSDLYDMLETPSPQKFLKEKKDLRNTIKYLLRKVNNTTFKNRNK